MRKESTPNSHRSGSRLEILQEACELGSDGWQNLSVRTLAKRINYSTFKLYHEFGNKEGLLYALQQWSVERLEQRLSDGVRSSDNARRGRLLEVSLVLWNFAHEERALFTVLFGGEGIICEGRLGENIQLATSYIWDRLEPAIPREQPQRMLHWWALTNGFINIDHSYARARYNVRDAYVEALESFPLTPSDSRL